MTPRIALIQRVHSDIFGTFGKITTPSGFSAISIELPWRGNKRNISCIPAGEYDCLFTPSPAFRREMYIAIKVTGRSGIRIHSGNLAGDVLKGLKSHFKGCIGMGMRVGLLGRQRAVLTSAPTVVAFERHMEKQPFKLVITDIPDYGV